MSGLPIDSKKYSSRQVEGANVTLTYWYEPPSSAELAERGAVGLFISLMGPDDFSGERATKFIWDSFREEYYQFSGDSIDAMRAGMKAAHQRLMELIRNEPGVSEQGVDLHLCAFTIIDSQMSVAMIGEPGVALGRGEKVISISEMLPAYSGEGYREDIPVGNFDLEKGDVLLISTPKLLDSLLSVLQTKEDSLSNWSFSSSEIESYAENLVGNQYIWLLGYDIEEKPIDRVKEAPTGAVEENASDRNDSVGEAVGGEEKEGKTSEEENEKTAGLYTPAGIWGKVTEFGGNKITPFFKGKNISERSKELIETVKSPEFRGNAARKVKSAFNSAKLGNLRQRKMVVGKPVTQITPKLIVVAAIVFVSAILIISYINRRNEEQRNTEISQTLSSVESMADSALEIWQTDADRSAVESELTEASELLGTLESYELSGDQSDLCEEMEDKIQNVYDTMNRVSPLTEELGTIEILTDLYVKIGEGVDIVDMGRYGSSLYLVDEVSHVLYRYSPGDDIVEKVANSEEILKSPKHLAIGDGYLFVFDSEVGVVTLDMNVNEPEWVFKVRPELSARTIGEITEMAAFADNVYLLKADEARVLKSYPAGSGYSYPEEYFRNGSFDKGVDILIDGNIYVLSNASEKIYRYFAGQQDTFSLTGFDTMPLGTLCCGDTNLNDTSKLYVYDEENSRVVSIEKPTAEKHPGVGVMLRQYVYRGDRDDIFQDVRDIVVDVDERVLYVLDGTRILQVLLENE